VEENNTLRYDLAELQMRLKTYDKAEKTVAQALQIEQGSTGDASGGNAATNNDLQSLISQARFLGLLARIQERSGNLEAAVQTLAEVKAVRGRVLKRVQLEQPDAVLEQRHLAAAACRQMAEHAVLQRNYAAAIGHYKAVFRIRIRIHRIHMFWASRIWIRIPLVRGMDPDPDPALEPDPDPSIIKQI
jgi:hypothetical protein